MRQWAFCEALNNNIQIIRTSCFNNHSEKNYKGFSNMPRYHRGSLSRVPTRINRTEDVLEVRFGPLTTSLQLIPCL